MCLSKVICTYYCVTVFVLVVFMKWDNKLYAIGVEEKEEYKILEINHTGSKRLGRIIPWRSSRLCVKNLSPLAKTQGTPREMNLYPVILNSHIPTS